MTDVKRRVLAILQDEVTGPLVEAYFGVSADSTPHFTGAWFERIAAEANSGADSDRFTSDDLVAVQMLSVTVPAQAAIQILGPFSSDLTSQLRLISTSLTPRDADGRKQLTDEESALHAVWETLEDVPGIGWVTAGKLCARKRPALAPVYDQHVRAAVGRPENWWSAVADLFHDDDVIAALRPHVESANRHSDAVPISELRTLDIAIWMRTYGYQWAPPELRPPGPPGPS